jgi:hypothetical protein
MSLQEPDLTVIRKKGMAFFIQEGKNLRKEINCMLNLSKQLNTCAGLFRPFNVLNRQVLLHPFYLQVQADFLRI